MVDRVRIIRHNTDLGSGIQEHQPGFRNVATTIRFHPSANPIEEELKKYRAMPGLASASSGVGESLDEIGDVWRAWATSSIESFCSLATDVVNERFRKTANYDCEPIEMRIRDATHRIEQGIRTWRDMKHQAMKYAAKYEEKVKKERDLFDTSLDKLEHLPHLDSVTKTKRDIFVQSIKTLYDEAHKAQLDHELRSQQTHNNRLLNIVKNVGYGDEIKGFYKDMETLNKEVAQTKAEAKATEESFIQQASAQCEEMRKLFIEQIYAPLTQSLGHEVIDPVKFKPRSLFEIREHMIELLETLHQPDARKIADAGFVTQELAKAKLHFQDLRLKASNCLSTYSNNAPDVNRVISESLLKANEEVVRLSQEVVAATQTRILSDIVEKLRQSIVLCQSLISRKKEVDQFYRTLQNDIKRTYIYSLRMMVRARTNAMAGKKHEAARAMQITSSSVANPGEMQLNQLNESRCAEQKLSPDLQFFAKLSETVAFQSRVYEELLQQKRASHMETLCDETISILQNVLKTFR